MKETNAKKAALVTSKQNHTKDVKKSKLSTKDQKIKKKQAKKPKKDPNQPKRPPSAFFVFLEDFRNTYKKKHPDVKGVSVIGKAGGVAWKAMTDADKQPYVNKALQRKADYEKSLAAYKLKQNGEAASPDESEKSRSEIHDDDEESGKEEDDDEE